jgi:MFS family permease
MSASTSPPTNRAPSPVAAENVAERLPMSEVRMSMGLVIAAWGFGAAFTNLTSGAVYTAFARSLGANNTVFGVLAAALPLMSFLQVAAAYLVERTRRRKRQMLIAGVVGRSLWIGAALAPLLSLAYPAEIPKQWVLSIVVGVVLLSSACQAFSSPAFFSWMTDLVPARVRPMFFARRMQIGTFVALITSTAGGLIADNYPSITVYCIILALAGVAGVMDVLFFIGVREPQKYESPAVEAALDDLAKELPSPLASIREPLQDPAVRRFLLFVSLLMSGYALQGPFLWVHCLEHLHMSKTATGLTLNGAPLLAMALTSRFWGGITRRYGNRPVMRLCSTGLILVPVGWLLATEDTQVLLWLMLFLSGILAGAIDLSNTNLLTGVAPNVPRSTLTAVFSICAGASFAISSVLAGKVADVLHDFKWEFMGHTYINYHLLFVAALIVRIINAVWVAPRLHEPEATGTRDTMREVVPQLVENVSARITRPFGSRDN